MLLRNAWYIAAWGDELGDAPLARRICNDPIVLFRDGKGRAAALADRCCHRAAPLSLGTVVEEGIQCGYHGLIIDATGCCVKVPGQRLIPDDARVRSYPLVEKNQLGLPRRRRGNMFVEDDFLADDQLAGGAAGRGSGRLRIDRGVDADFFLRRCCRDAGEKGNPGEGDGAQRREGDDRH